MEKIIIPKNSENQIEVNQSEYKGTTYTHLRNYYLDKEGEWRPTKQGIALNPDQWQELLTKLKKQKLI